MKRMIEKENNKLQKATIKKILYRLKKYRHFILAAIIMAGVTVATSLYIPVLIGDAIDHIEDSRRVDFGGLLPILVKIGKSSV